MTPSDKDYIFRLYTQSVPLREGEQRVDMFRQPFAEMRLGQCVLAPSYHWQGQCGTEFPCARKRNIRRV